MSDTWPEEITPLPETYAIIQEDSTAEDTGALSDTSVTGAKWTGILQPGQIINVQVKGQVNLPIDGEIINYVRLCLPGDENYPTCTPLNECDQQRDDCATPVDLALEKFVSKTEVNVDDKIFYEFKITNNGSATVYGFDVKEEWPNGVTAISNPALNSNNSQVTEIGSISGDPNSQLVWKGELRPEEFVSFKVEATVSEDIMVEQIAENKACVEDPLDEAGESIIELDYSNNCDDKTITPIPIPLPRTGGAVFSIGLGVIILIGIAIYYQKTFSQNRASLEKAKNEQADNQEEDQ